MPLSVLEPEPGSRSVHAKIANAIYEKSRPFNPVLTRKFILYLALGLLFAGLVSTIAMFTDRQRASLAKILSTILMCTLGVFFFNTACAFR